MNENRKVGGAIAVVTAVGFAIGWALGPEWSAAAAQIAIADAQGTGSMGGLTQAVTVGALWLGGFLIAIVPGAIIGASTVTWRQAGFAVLVVVLPLGLLLGFGWTAGVGGPEGLAADDLITVALAMLFGAGLGSLLGYAIGRSTARRRGRA